MNLHEDISSDELDDLEAGLRALRPRAPSEGFADRVAVETRLRELRPRRPSPEFDARVMRACAERDAPRLLRFPRALIPAAAAAALVLAFLPAFTGRRPAGAEPAPVASAPGEASAPLLAAAEPEAPAEPLHLPVINLPDGRAYRPVLRPRPVSPDVFRAMPGGAVMPVSLPASARVDYEPVIFD